MQMGEMLSSILKGRGNGSFVRDAAIQRPEMLRAWCNVRYVGCNRSILLPR